jgi:hypothetical protein
MNKFKQELVKEKIDPELYLQECKKNAVKHGYDPEKLSFADDNKHKLQYETPEGKIIKFGAAAYRDHIMYLFLEKR